MAFQKTSYLSNISQNGTHDSNIKYKKKYGRLKKKMKYLVFENAALCDEVAKVQENVLLVKEERKYLFQKLLEYEEITEAYQPPGQNSDSHSSAYSDDDLPTKKFKPKHENDMPTKQTLPICLGNLTVYSLGNVIWDRTSYHNENAIYPVGFVSTRIYGSLRDPLKKCVYTCKITDGGAEPRFEIVVDSDAESPIMGSSPDYCHQILLQYINNSADIMNFSLSGKGAKFFGLTHPTVLNMILNLDGARKCLNYKWGQGVKTEDFNDDNDPTINFDKLQKCIISPYHTMAEIKEEPPDDILDFAEH